MSEMTEWPGYVSKQVREELKSPFANKRYGTEFGERKRRQPQVFIIPELKTAYLRAIYAQDGLTTA